MSRNNQMIGRIGEKSFSLLCSMADVSCNGSSEDDYGWDALIEFPPRHYPLLPVDMRPVQLGAQVQLKTTTTDTRSVALSLSNALRYAKSPMPTFVILACIEGGTLRYFVRHVWFGLIGAWLKAAREADARGVTAVHHETVRLTFEPRDERPEGDLLSWIEGEIIQVGPDYASTKRRFADTIGFEDGCGVAEMTFTIDGEDDFLDQQLGLRGPLQVSRFKLTSRRFGINAIRPEVDVTDGTIEVAGHASTVVLHLELSSGRRLSRSATMISALDGRRRAWRIRSGAVDLVARHNGHLAVTATMDRTVRYDVEDLASFAHLRSSEPGEQVLVEVDTGAGRQ